MVPKNDESLPVDEGREEEVNEVSDIASKINPNIKILKNVGLKEDEKIVEEGKDPTEEITFIEGIPTSGTSKGIIKVKGKEYFTHKRVKKEHEYLSYLKLYFIYPLVISLSMFLIGIFIGSMMVLSGLFNSSPKQTIPKTGFTNRSSLFVQVPVYSSQDGKEYIIEHFEGSKKTLRKWWKSGSIKSYNKKIHLKEMPVIGRYAIGLFSKKGAQGVYGTYLGIDSKKFKSLEMIVYGFGKKSGNLKINLYDDDNKNYKLETDFINENSLNFDDVYTYNLVINWKGWKKVSIPLKDFKDSNPLIGDDIFNPIQKKGSGGLIALEFLIKNRFNCLIDSIKLI